ncbi:unnamed protein product [Moneuplotes crassus]|uniref:G domain-containing protein n=2 Tax=Euplotes crassus TaxID=5936 RepID=A0AAD1U4C8_EUPCR|nr:unnamed protein product [Moneuplotes crassus]
MGKHNKKKKSKGTNASLGKSLINNLKKKTDKKNYVSDLHRFEDRKFERTDLTSILEQDSLNEFADLVSLSQKKAQVLRGKEISEEAESSKNPNLAVFEHVIDKGIIRPKYAPLKLPRKPAWNKNMTKAELITNENKAFLEWRRDVAFMEEGNVNLAMTPFEKNLAVWKQLWSVVERCQILIQIVDARNPYFYYSADLERYIKELDGNKHYLLLLNKSDYLDEAQIQHWNDYFKEKGVEHIFFSAMAEKTRMERQEQQNKAKDLPKTGVANEMLGDIREAIQEDEEETKELEKVDEILEKGELSLLDDTTIYSREELMRLIRVFMKQRCDKPEGKDGRHNIGMIGYPNVGKSSVINVLCGSKKVGVASRPGKTKHFQTIYLGSDICLCDCPGLVFPSFASSKSEMVCCGVIPIDNLRDIKGPMELVAQRIPKEMFEQEYKISLPETYSASEVLQVYSGFKGYVTGRGLPDENKAARIMLKDYNNGKLLFVHLRPDYDPEKHGYVNQSNVEYTMKFSIPEPDEESKDGQSETISDASMLSAADPRTEVGIHYSTKNQQFTNQMEKKFDKDFFEQKSQKKMTKAQRRELKFAKKRGEEPESVDLDNPRINKGKGKRAVGGYNEKKKTGVNSNKVSHFSGLEFD